MNEFDRGYIVGLIEGEGSVGIQKNFNKRDGYHNLIVKVRIANTNRQLLEATQKIIGGTIYKSGGTNRNKVCWNLQLKKHDEVLRLLEEIEPFLIVKKEQAKLVIEFIKSRQNQKEQRNTKGQFMPRPFLPRELEMVSLLYSLNKRGLRGVLNEKDFNQYSAT